MSIEVRNVDKQFTKGTAILTNVAMNVAEGEMVAFLGPSGSGKTTLLRIIAGLDAPSSGEVYIRGRRVDALPPQKRGIGFVFQNYALFRHMTVFENLAFGLRVQKRPELEIRERVDKLLDLIRLPDMAGRYPEQLSGGQRQRVALARALAPEPQVLLLDEPFGAVDAKIRKELRQWVRRVHNEVGITSIFVTHDQEEAVELADRIVVLNQGRVEQVGTAREIYQEPATHFVASFIGDTNEYAGNTRNGVVEVGPLRLPAGALPDDEPVHVVVRPTHVDIHETIQDGDAAAEVLGLQFMGTTYTVYLELAQGFLLRAMVTEGNQPLLRVGDRVGISIRHYKLFPRKLAS